MKLNALKRDAAVFLNGTITIVHALVRLALITTGLHWTRQGRRIYR